MKNWILLVTFLSVSNVFAQITFNKRLHFEYPASVYTNVIVTDSSYYVVGAIAGISPPNLVGSIFAKFNLEGDSVFTKTISSDEIIFETWENTLMSLPNGNLVASGSMWDTSGAKTVLLIHYLTSGDTLSTKKYSHPLPDQYPALHGVDFGIHPNGGYVFLTKIRVNDEPDDVDYYVFKTDEIGNIEWDFIAYDSKWDVPLSLVINENTGNIILGGRKTNQNIAVENYQYQTHIFALDSLGNELWTYLSSNFDGLRDGARDMILLDDGSLIVASGIGYEQDWPSVNVVWFEKSVFKLNANQEVEWEVTFPEDSLAGRARTTNLLNTSDNSGFILAGLDVVSDWEVTFQQMGWLAKLSYDGDSIWTRRYKYLDTDKSDHEFYDLKETPDGGFILCGESRDRTPSAEIPQQGWLLKLDEYGCLIPNCHLIDNITETETVSYELKLYPNPTSDYLNIFMRHHRGNRDFTFRIRNGLGQEVAVFEQQTIQEETLMIDLVGYSSGVYYLEVVQEGRILEVKKFVVN